MTGHLDMKRCFKSVENGGKVPQQFITGYLMRAEFLFAQWSKLRNDKETRNFVSSTLYPIQKWRRELVSNELHEQWARDARHEGGTPDPLYRLPYMSRNGNFRAPGTSRATAVPSAQSPSTLIFYLYFS